MGPDLWRKHTRRAIAVICCCSLTVVSTRAMWAISRRCPTSDSSGTRFRVILFALERTMAQHFLLSAAARTLSLKAIYVEGEDAAYDQFCKLRWPATAGAPICPRCAWQEAYSLSTRRRFKCKACHHQFSVTSGTIFASRKLAFVDLLGAIALFVNAAKGLSALQLSR